MKAKIPIVALAAVVAILIFMLSYDSIWIIDSITYQYNIATGEPIRNISDIFESQYAHYFSWNGRYVAHWLCQLFLPLLGNLAFSVANSLMYVALIFLIMKVATKEAITVPLISTSILLVLLFCDTNYTPPFQIGYIWMSVLVLAFLHVFFVYAALPRRGPLTCLGLTLFSIIAGNAQEAINIGVGGALIIFILAHLRRLSPGQWCMAIGFGVGALFLCLAPGNMARVDEMKTAPLFSIVNFVVSLRVTYIFVALLAYRLMRRQISLKSFYHRNSFYVNAIVVLLIFNFIIGVGGYRQLFGIELFSTVLIIRLLRRGSFPILLSVLLAILTAWIYMLKFKEIEKARATYDEVAEKIAEAPSGPIFVDFPAFNPWMHPTAVYRYGFYLDYALESTRLSLTSVQDPTKIPCYPAKAKEIVENGSGNMVCEYLPGEFMLVQDKNEPKNFVVNRAIHIMGLRIPMSPYHVEFDPESYYNTMRANIMYIPTTMPMVVNESVTIE